MLNFEDWLNENCNKKDWSETANQANDFLHTSDVIEYVEKYEEYKQSQPKTFEQASRVMIKHLCDNYHPHVYAIVTPTTSELLEGMKSIGNVLDYVRD